MDLRVSDLMTVQEAAEHLGVSRFKMARLIADGELPTFTTPLDRRRKLVRKEDVEALRERALPTSEWPRAHKEAA